MEKMSKEARQKANEYMREWRRHNKDKLRQYNINYWERKAGNISLVQQVKQLNWEGLTQREISEKLDISLGAVNKYLHR